MQFMTLTLLEATIRALGSMCRSFHLGPCVCGAPTYQQPCPNCGFYPMGFDPAYLKAHQDICADRERWVKTVNRAGNIALWYLLDCNRTLAWEKDPVYRAEVEETRRKAASMQWPEPGLIWDLVHLRASLKLPWEQERKKWKLLTNLTRILSQDNPRGELWCKRCKSPGTEASNCEPYSRHCAYVSYNKRRN